MSSAPVWEAAWHPHRQRYYFQDRVSGRSSWSRPAGCTLQLPVKPPADQNDELPMPPENVPLGWSVAFSWSNKRYFYYRTDMPTERTWLRPAPLALPPRSSSAAPGTAMIGDSGAGPGERRVGKKAQVLTDKYFTQTLWDPEAFAHRIQEAIHGKDQHILREVLYEVAESNEERLVKGRLRIPVPTTVSVEHATCLRALEEGKIEDYGAEPRVTINSTSVSEAVVFFASQDVRRVVCCINEADGGQPGGGYMSGDKGVEEDMCRRIPGLHPSLEGAKEAGCYPFGPLTVDMDEEGKWADALFTPKALIVRGSEEEGFPIYSQDKRCPVSILSVCPPYARTATRAENVPDELLTQSVLSIFVAPVFKEPRCTTLVVGSWGCKHAVLMEKMVDLLVKAVIGELPGMPIKLGRLYHEVHFALSEAFDPGKTIYETFCKALRRERVPFTEV